MAEREVIRDRPTREREVVVDERPRRGGGGGAIIAAIVGILLLLLVGWFLLNALGIMGDAAENAENAEVNVPEEVNVDADVDSQ